MTVPTRQTIFLLEKFGDPGQLAVTEADVPEPLPGRRQDRADASPSAK